MLGEPLRVGVVDAPKEVRIFARVPFVREPNARHVLVAEVLVQLDVERLLVERAGRRGNPIVIRVVSGRSNVQIR